MSSPFFSVLMPVYNSQKFLRRAVDSVLNQSFQDFELIIVDDCSTDGSADILQEYQQQDKRVVIVKTKANLGVANARNEGMKLVQGRFLTFVDSDDYIEPDLFLNVKEKINSTGAQLIKYSVVEQYYDAQQNFIGKKEVCLKDEVLNSVTDIRNAILPMEKLPLFGYLWNSFYDLKTVPKDLWNFDTHMYVNEDFMMNMKLIEHIEVMVCMGYIGYHYEKHVNSSLSTKQNDLYYECSKPKIEILLKKYQEWGLLTSSRKTEIYWLYIRIVYSTISRIIDTSSIAEARNTLIKIYHDNLFDRFCTDQTIEFVYSKKEYFMYRLLKNKGIISVLLLCKIISFMKTHFRVIFSKIKK